MWRTRSVSAACPAKEPEWSAWVGMTTFSPGAVAPAKVWLHIAQTTRFFLGNNSLLIPPHSGSRSGHIHHHDVRMENHHIATLSAHSQEVCGLKWSPDGRYLASGGNDNMVYLWPRVQEGGIGSNSQPIRRWGEHLGAVKVSILAQMRAGNSSRLPRLKDQSWSLV